MSISPEQEDVFKLKNLLEGAIASVSNTTRLARQDIVELIEHMHVDRVSELQPAIMEMERFGPLAGPLATGLAGMIRDLSVATDLDTDEITAVLSESEQASLDDLVSRLREKSRNNRWNLAAV